MSLLCPKCHNPMHQYERNGVVLDQCTECKGLFLDRGELERLVSAETAYYGNSGGGAPRAYAEPPSRYDPRYEQPRQEHQRYRKHSDDDDDHYYRGGSHGKRKKRSFLEELFD